MDEYDGDPGDLFAIPDLWVPSTYLGDIHENLSSLFSPQKLDDFDGRLPDILTQSEEEDMFFSLPDLNSSENLSTASNLTEPAKEIFCAVEAEKGEYDDIWLLPEESHFKVPKIQSWDGFSDPTKKESYTSYITETTPSLFDTALAEEADSLHVGNTCHVIVDASVFYSSLLSLGQGRNSTLFVWAEENRSFIPARPRMRVSGYSGHALDGLLVTFMVCGNVTKSLLSFVEKTLAFNRSPGQIALAGAISTLLATIQSRLTASSSIENTILQLQAMFKPAKSILVSFQRIVDSVSATRSDEAMLSTVFEEVQLLEQRPDSLREILLEILCRVSRPWLEFTGEWLGLQREVGIPLTKGGSGRSFVKVEDREWIDEKGIGLQEPDYVLDLDMVPSFITPADARTMFEVGRSLRFLRTHHADHPLARPDVVSSANPPPLEWKFSWEDIAGVEAKARQYQKDLTMAIQHFSEMSSTSSIAQPDVPPELGHFELNYFGKPEEDMQAEVLASIDMFNEPLRQINMQDRLSGLLNTYLSLNNESSRDHDLIFSPPVCLTPFLSFNPIIMAQARVVNATCLRMFFKCHKLRKHLSLQRNFYLLGNGVFSSRLSQALFDPELESAERHRGVARSGGIMGLRLGGRDKWPPASSELRLTLMGVLTESYVSSNPTNSLRACGYPNSQISLPGDLSFAVRDMSPEEIENCKNPDSIEALDFLRLSYKPPPPLEAVITPMILQKYDHLFKLLLRMVRMLYVISSLFRNATDRTSSWQGIDHVAQRFRIEAHHFISIVSGYFFDTGIESTWRVFECKLDQIEKRIDADDAKSIIYSNEGLDKLRDYHERVLDRIMFALFLKKRQQPIMNLLGEIFTLILQFSKHSREQALGTKSKMGADDEVRKMYLGFRKKVSVFIAVCKGLSEKRGYGQEHRTGRKTSSEEGLFDSEDLAEDNTILQLLTRLEMSNYYSKVVDV